MFEEYLENKLSEIDGAGLLRKLRLISSNPSAKIIIGDKEYINFSSNNYLDLAGNEEINKAASQAALQYGAGGASSRLVGGNFQVHKMLEGSLASFKNKKACLVFPSGYQTNVGVISALAQKSDNACIVMDKLNHASLWDGAKLSGCRIFVYEHCDMNSLESVLKRTKDYKLKLAVTESVFSMDGDIAPLAQFARLCRNYGAVSMIDEAHCSGIFGKNGSGLDEEIGADADIIIGTLSKAFGVQGGFVCGGQKLIDYLINKSRAFIYTTAISPVIAAAALKSLEIIIKSDSKRKLLLSNAQYLRDKLKSLGFDAGNSQTQIIPVITGSLSNTQRVADMLMKNGIFAPAIKPPTVPEGRSRIRISLTSAHTKEDLDKLIKELK
ncbi:MAG: 8-amino-7-oxononanoate synthase [Endomicrobium sp.]|nr:8-amino-7-oxononanoate synthase [Endomicrobium sp.]